MKLYDSYIYNDWHFPSSNVIVSWKLKVYYYIFCAGPWTWIRHGENVILTYMYYYTVISWLCGEQSNYCPEVVEKIWETNSTTEGQINGLTVPQVALK